MAGLWIKWMKGLAMKREVLVMSAALGVDRHEVAGRLMTLWEWCDDNLSAHDVDESGNATVTLGTLPERTIDAVAGVTGFAQAMSDAGWMRNVDGSVVFPNFGRHNGETAKTRALTASRVAGHKAARKREGNAEGNASTVTSALPREEKRREENTEHTYTSPDGDFLLEPVQQEPSTKSQPKPAPYSPAFERFWAVYPDYRKTGKGAAWRAWQKAIRGTSAETIIAAAERYAASPKGQGEFAKAPTSWLNARCWEDAPEAWGSPPEKKQRLPTAEELANWTPH